MSLHLPPRVTLIEVGPRDGFQFESKIIPTELKVDIISGLIDAGLRHIQVTSFVHPRRVPQMADAEELMKRLPQHEGVTYSGLVLNSKGVERARLAGLSWVEVSISASDTHSRKNAGMSQAQAVAQGKEMIRLAQECDMRVRAGIQCAFGCVYEGEIPDGRVLGIAENFMALGIDMLVISDTTGMGNPLAVTALMEKLIPIAGETPIVLHLHDTRALGLVNLMAAMACGITHFDTALAGMGGCPFVRGAAGNIATEDTAYLMASMDIETGVDIAKVANCSRRLEQFLEKRFAGKMYRQV